MKKLKNRWLIWTSKALVSLISMLGLSSCWFQPCMYGSPDPNWNPDSTGTDSIDSVKRPREPEFKAMYSVSPARFQKVNEIDKEGVEIEIKQD